MRAMNKGKFHTPKYQEGDRIVRMTETDVERLLSLKRRVNAKGVVGTDWEEGGSQGDAAAPWSFAPGHRDEALCSCSR